MSGLADDRRPPNPPAVPARRRSSSPSPPAETKMSEDADSAYYSCIDSPHGSLERKADELEASRGVRVVRELLVTERRYVEDLRLILDRFAIPGQLHLSADDCTTIFSNWKQLTLFHRYFLSRLELAWRDPDLIAACFIDSECHFRQYGVYCKNYFRAIRRVNQLLAGDNTSPAAAFLRSASARSRLPLAAFLLKPVQRIVKYPLLLSSLVGALSAPQSASVLTACHRLRAIIAVVDEVQRNPAGRLEALQSRLVPSSPPVYLQEHAPLLLEAELCLVEHREAVRYALLLRGLLLFAKVVSGDKLRVKRTIPVRRIKLLKSWPRQPAFLQLWVSETGQVTPLTLRLASGLERDRWVDCLADLLRLHAERTAASGSLHRVCPSQSDCDLRQPDADEVEVRRHSAALDDDKKGGLRVTRRPLDRCPEDQQLEFGMPRRRMVVTEAINENQPNPAWDQTEVETPPDSPSRRSSTSNKSSLRRSLSRTLSSLFRTSAPSSPKPVDAQTSPALRMTPATPPPPPESPATLPRLYQKRQQVTPQVNLRRKTREEYDKSASLTRIADLNDSGLDKAKSSSDITEPRRRWRSTLQSDGKEGKLRFSSTFVRKSMGDHLDAPETPAEDGVFDEVDSPFEHRIHSLARHKPRSRAVKREPSRVERKEAYSSSDLRYRTSSMSGSTGTLTRLARKAPVAVINDL